MHTYIIQVLWIWLSMGMSLEIWTTLCLLLSYLQLDVQSLAATSRPRLPETGTKMFVFKTTCNAFCGRYCFETVTAQK